MECQVTWQVSIAHPIHSGVSTRQQFSHSNSGPSGIFSNDSYPERVGTPRLTNQLAISRSIAANSPEPRREPYPIIADILQRQLGQKLFELTRVRIS
jgi:hypothetical protein